jgi:hypothetical protein
VDESTPAAVAEKLKTLCGNPAALGDYRARIRKRFSELTDTRRSEVQALNARIND